MKTLTEIPGVMAELLKRADQREQHPSLFARFFGGKRKPREPRTIRYQLPGGERHYSPER